MARLNQAEKNIPEFVLSLRPAIEDLDKFAVNAIGGLRQANETRLLRNLLNQNIGIAPIDTGNLLIAGGEAVKWLQAANEKKLLQKLAKSGSSLLGPDLEELSTQTSVAAQNLACAHETKILASLAHEPPILQIPDIGIFENEVYNAIRALHQANEFRIFQKLRRRPDTLELTSLTPLAITCSRARILLKEVYDIRLLQKLNHHGKPFCLPKISSFGARARLLSKRLKISQETKILSAIVKRERKRNKVIEKCFLNAEWAGSDLKRWNRVFAEYEKFPKQMKILNRLIEEAHSQFLGILTKTGIMEEIEKKCSDNPFLIREFTILQRLMNNYYSEQKSKMIDAKASHHNLVNTYLKM